MEYSVDLTVEARFEERSKFLCNVRQKSYNFYSPSRFFVDPPER
jgi:hypothetical protein